MDTPDKRLFEADIRRAEFRNGVVGGWWGLPEESILPAEADWPIWILWIAAAPREAAPDRFHVSLNLDGYRTVAPTGTFWDPATKSMLEVAKRPKGREGSRFAKVFRTDWKGGRAFYHPYDRVATKGHPKWPVQHPHLVWTANHTIVDYLVEFRSLLNSGDYLGI